jgi:hypothetical protein
MRKNLVEKESLEETIKKSSNGHTNNDSLKNVSKFAKDVNNLYSSNPEVKLDESTKKNKNLNETLQKSNTDTGDFKKKVYDFFSSNFGIDLYNLENKQELKKVNNVLNTVQSDLTNIEKILNGKEVYNPPSSNNEDILNYISSISPERKGLFFKNSELKDILIMYKSHEDELDIHLKHFENQISSVDEKLNEKSGSLNVKGLIELKKEKMNYMREADMHTRKIEDIRYDMDKYISLQQETESIIYKHLNTLDNGRILYNTLNAILKAGPGISRENKLLEKIDRNLNAATNMCERLYPFAKEHVDNMKNSSKSFDERVKKVTTDDKGNQLSLEILDMQKSLYNSTMSNMKARRETYFRNLGF